MLRLSGKESKDITPESFPKYSTIASKNARSGKDRSKRYLAKGAKTSEIIAASPPKTISGGIVQSTKKLTTTDHTEYVPKVVKSIGKVASWAESVVTKSSDTKSLSRPKI